MAFFLSGVTSVEDLALMTGTRPSYVASVLQAAGLLSGYYDLYTSTGQPLNVYSKFFTNRLGFKDVETAQRSVDWIDRLYRQFAQSGDRSGQHHAMMMALTMLNRARWTGKHLEAEPYRQWLTAVLERINPPASLPEDTEGS